VVVRTRPSRTPTPPCGRGCVSTRASIPVGVTDAPTTTPAGRAGPSTTRRSSGCGVRKASAWSSVVDEHTRGCLGGLVERSITGEVLATELNRITATRGGGPAVLRLDNGPEMIAAALAEWAGTRTGMLFIPPGEPWRNPFIESFNGSPARRMPQHPPVPTPRSPSATGRRSTTTTGRTHRWATEPHVPTLRSVPTNWLSRVWCRVPTSRSRRGCVRRAWSSTMRRGT
jgi:hypothetical protein